MQPAQVKVRCVFVGRMSRCPCSTRVHVCQSQSTACPSDGELSWGCELTSLAPHVSSAFECALKRALGQQQPCSTRVHVCQNQSTACPSEGELSWGCELTFLSPHVSSAFECALTRALGQRQPCSNGHRCSNAQETRHSATASSSSAPLCFQPSISHMKLAHTHTQTLLLTA